MISKGYIQGKTPEMQFFKLSLRRYKIGKTKEAFQDKHWISIHCVWTKFSKLNFVPREPRVSLTSCGHSRKLSGESVLQIRRRDSVMKLETMLGEEPWRLVDQCSTRTCPAKQPSAELMALSTRSPTFHGVVTSRS